MTDTDNRTLVDEEPIGLDQSNGDPTDVESVDVESADVESVDVESADVEPGGPDVDAGDRESIPVEEWLEEVATITRDIHRPELETGAQSLDGSNTPSAPGSEIVGSFRPIVSTGPAGSADPGRGRQEGSVVIGIVQTLPNGDYSRPIPLSAGPRLPDLNRILSLVMVVVGLMALGGVVGYGAAGLIPERWTAEAEIIMEAGQEQPDRYLGTQQVLVQSSAVLDRAVTELPVDRTYVEDELKVFPIESGLALAINFVDNDPELARAVVESVLASFMAEVDAGAADTTAAVYRQRLDQLVEQRNLVEQRLAALEKANAEAESAELPLPYPGDVRRLATESDQLLGQIVTLEETLLNLEIGAAQRVDAVIVTEPRVLAEPTWPKPLALAAVGMLAGAVLAALGLFLLSGYEAAASATEEMA